jgi:hypothetical protein
MCTLDQSTTAFIVVSFLTGVAAGMVLRSGWKHLKELMVDL